MKNNILKITILSMIALSVSAINLFSIIGIEYTSVDISEKSYKALTGPTPYLADDFVDYPALNIDHNDGYVKVTIPFTAGFHGDEKTDLWISVNGFVTFDPPKNLPQNNPQGLFINQNTTFQTDVVAPFWGDHHYRDGADIINGYTVSSISTKWEDKDGPNECFVIEWKDLNINEHISNKPTSVASFQCRIYKSQDASSIQSDIEFAYGLIGSGTDANIIGASIGVKGQTGDFINGLHHSIRDVDDKVTNLTYYNQKTFATTLSSFWQPSGGSNYRIRFVARPTIKVLDFWGDGDTDLSHHESGRHYQLPQNRFVNFADVRLLMRSMATGQYLDSSLYGAAFHADVTHNGRFSLRDTVVWLRNPVTGLFVDPDGDDICYTLITDVNGKITGYNMLEKCDPLRPVIDNDNFVTKVDSTLKDNIEVRAYYWNDSLPQNVSDFNQLHFYANEFDAARIVEYLGAKLPFLPWVWDTAQSHGKLTIENKIASDIAFGKMNRVNDNQVKLPVYLNGDYNGAVSIKLNIDADIAAIDLVSNDESVLLTDNSNNTLVIAGSINYNSELPVAYIIINTDKNSVNISNVSFNETMKANRNANIESNEESLANNNAISFTGNTDINFNAQEDGTYTLVVYNMMGSVVSTKSANITTGLNSFNWDATSTNGNKVNKGMYIYTISNASENITNGKLIVE